MPRDKGGWQVAPSPDGRYFVTGSNDAEGFAEAIEKYLLGDGA